MINDWLLQVYVTAHTVHKIVLAKRKTQYPGSNFPPNVSFYLFTSSIECTSSCQCEGEGTMHVTCVIRVRVYFTHVRSLRHPSNPATTRLPIECRLQMVEPLIKEERWEIWWWVETYRAPFHHVLCSYLFSSGSWPGIEAWKLDFTQFLSCSYKSNS